VLGEIGCLLLGKVVPFILFYSHSIKRDTNWCCGINHYHLVLQTPRFTDKQDALNGFLIIHYMVHLRALTLLTKT
jgi:hypothetical protein